MKSNWTSSLLVLAAVLVLLLNNRLDLLVVVAPVSIVAAMAALHYTGIASVEYKRKR